MLMSFRCCSGPMVSDPIGNHRFLIMQRYAKCIVLALALVAGGTAFAGTDSPFRVSVAPTNTPADPRVLAVAVTVPARHHLYADTFAVSVPEPARLEPLQMPSSVDVKDPFSGTVRPVFERDFVALYRLTHWPSASVPVTVRWQGCDETLCFFPETRTFEAMFTEGGGEAVAAPKPVATAAAGAEWRALTNRFTVVATRTGFLDVPAMLDFLAAPPPAGVRATDTPPPAQPETALPGTVWGLLGVVLLGGLALNLTPCVLPMIPINLAIIGAGVRAGRRSRGFALGALYGAGMALAYGALGMLVALTGATFGAINASPWFNLGVAAIFGLLALAMFDVVAIDFSRYQSKLERVGQGGMLAVVLLGALSALLAGACVAPVVISVLLYAAAAYARGDGWGLLLPLLLGVGMALPWPFAGAGLSLLPKPGRWMERVKHAFGVLILGIALYYAYTGLQLWRARQTPPERESQRLAEALASAARDGKPVWIDFWATWCKTCAAMEATTLKDTAVRGRLAEYTVVKFQAEQPSAQPTRDVLDAFGVWGLPTYVILSPIEGGGPE